MIKHSDIGSSIFTRSKALFTLLSTQQITLAGNAALKIYGRLDCSSGRRLKPDKRVFFKDEEEAVLQGFRPCGHCMKESYSYWKKKV